VSNGLALCKIHHAAFDQHMLAVTPDYEVRIRKDILEEEDGPMLQHGLKDMHGGTLRVVPKVQHHRPERELLAWRFERFRKAE
jgi:putative restriction endonuclease